MFAGKGIHTIGKPRSSKVKWVMEYQLHAYYVDLKPERKNELV